MTYIVICIRSRGKKKRHWENFLVAWTLSQETIFYEKITIGVCPSRDILTKHAVPYLTVDISNEGMQFFIMILLVNYFF